MSVNHFTIAPRTGNEVERLAAVAAYRATNSQPDPLLGEIVAETARFFDAPIVLVSIVDDDQQCFQACIGLSVNSTPRSISFCGHAILSAQPFIVPDATLDERFAGNPLVIAPPHIRFYAGAPLISPEGHAIGTLCVIDLKPRSFGEADVAALQQRASRVMARLEEGRGAGA
jgi:GAF domain-containing protein